MDVLEFSLAFTASIDKETGNLSCIFTLECRETEAVLRHELEVNRKIVIQIASTNPTKMWDFGRSLGN